jgi:DNA helicase-2/ATP-dependent DNA helicase PcrA
MLTESDNRRLLATFRLLADPRDSLAWATLLHLTRGIGESFSDYIYERARMGHIKFGDALFDAQAANFPNAPRSAAQAQQVMESVTGWLNGHPLPVEYPEHGWGHWMIEVSGGDIVPKPTANFGALLEALDTLIEEDQNLGRFLGQITPLGKDRALAESQGVRIMTMTGSKGLTVRATIIAGVDDGIVPRPDHDLGEERRLLYVAMTRPKEFLFATWAGQRRGPTARAGRQRPLRERRRPTQFFDGGPVRSQDGENYLRQREGA